MLVSIRMARMGWFKPAVGVLLSFDCYLRVGELTNICISDIADAGDRRLGHAHTGMAIRLRRTKTGPNQWVTLTSSDVIVLVRCLVDEARSSVSSESNPGNQLVFNFSPAQFRLYLRRSVVAVGLAHVRYVPHSLRHGGATHDFISGVPIETVLAKGRWQSTKSARHYIQAGRSILLSTTIPQRQWNEARYMAQNVIGNITDAYESYLLSQYSR